MSKEKDSFAILKRLADIEAKGKGVSLPFHHPRYLWSVRVMGNLYFNEIGVQQRPDGFYADICLASTMLKARAVFKTIVWDPKFLTLEGVELKPNFHLNSFRPGNFGYPSIICDVATYIDFWKGQADSLLVRQNREGVLKVLGIMAQRKIISEDSVKDIEKKVRGKGPFNIVPEIRLSIKIDTPNAFEFFDQLMEKITFLFPLLHLAIFGENKGPWAKEESFYANDLLSFRYRPYGLHERCYLTFENCYNDLAVVKMTESYPIQERWVAESRYISFASLDNLLEIVKGTGLKKGNLSPFGKVTEFDQQALNFVFNGIGWASNKATAIDSGRNNEKAKIAYWALVNEMKSNRDGEEKWEAMLEKSRKAEECAQYNLRVFNVGQADCSALVKNGVPIAVFDIGSGSKEPPSCLLPFLSTMHNGLFVISHCDTDHLSLEEHFHQAFSDNFWLLPFPTIRNSYIENLLKGLEPFTSHFKVLDDNSVKTTDPFKFDVINVYQANPSQKDPNQSTLENAHCLLAEIVANKTALIPGDSLYKEYPKSFSPDILVVPHHACRLKHPTCFPEKMVLKQTGEAYLPVSEKGFGRPRYHPNSEHYDYYASADYTLYRFSRKGQPVYFEHGEHGVAPEGVHLITDEDFYDFSLN